MKKYLKAFLIAGLTAAVCSQLCAPAAVMADENTVNSMSFAEAEQAMKTEGVSFYQYLESQLDDAGRKNEGDYNTVANVQSNVDYYNNLAASQGESYRISMNVADTNDTLVRSDGLFMIGDEVIEADQYSITNNAFSFEQIRKAIEEMRRYNEIRVSEGLSARLMWDLAL